MPRPPGPDQATSRSKTTSAFIGDGEPAPRPPRHQLPKMVSMHPPFGSKTGFKPVTFRSRRPSPRLSRNCANQNSFEIFLASRILSGIMSRGSGGRLAVWIRSLSSGFLHPPGAPRPAEIVPAVTAPLDEASHGPLLSRLCPSRLFLEKLAGSPSTRSSPAAGANPPICKFLPPAAVGPPAAPRHPAPRNPHTPCRPARPQ
jgi:hypothetical protein